MKTSASTEEVSSEGMEKRAKRHKCQRGAPFAREKTEGGLKKELETGLQICGAGRKSRKKPMLVMGKKPMGNPGPKL